MNKMWAGRFSKQLDNLADKFNSSIAVDGKMFREDINGSIAHAIMLGDSGILDKSEASKIVGELQRILFDLENGRLKIDENAEDIHMFVEGELTKRLGDLGKKLHTARSRNDQVATDIRLYLKSQSKDLSDAILHLIDTIVFLADENKETVMAGTTHLQAAQPITLAHQLMAYASMFFRDYTRLNDAVSRMNLCPLGSCALAGTTYPINRHLTSELLGFDAPVLNSIDGVSDRDFCLELSSVISIFMMHLSKLAEEIIIFSSTPYSYIELDDSYSTGSSIMPQKKNPDMAELIRGKTGRAYGNMVALFTMMKALPLAYNKDMQEDKEQIFDSYETAIDSAIIMSGMLKTTKINKDKMAKSAKFGYINATDCADYLTKKGMPFRDAYKAIGELVSYAIENGKSLDELSLEEFKKASNLFEKDIYGEIEINNCVQKRTSFGGTGATQKTINVFKEFLSKNLNKIKEDKQ